MEYLSEAHKKVQENVIQANSELVVESKQAGVTIYGNIAGFLENQENTIDELADRIGSYLAYQKGIELTQEYEKNSSLYEKYIKNNPLKLAKLEEQRRMQSEMIIGGTQFVIKGGVFVTKKILAYMDKKRVMESVWSLCVTYANTITKKDYSEFSQVEGLLGYISMQLFGKIKKDYLNSNEKLKEDIVLPSEESQIKHISLILYLIYAQKHTQSYCYDDKEGDMGALFAYWALLGIFRIEALALFKEYEQVRIMNMYDYSRLNTAMQNVYHNLCITVPHINMRKAREINNEMLLYVPNGDKQLAARKVGKMIGKSIIATGGVVGGMVTENPALLETASSAAVSLLEDISDTEIIGNCLNDAGLDEDKVKKCIEEAKKKQRNNNI